MPDRIPPHKVCEFLASDEDRVAMCERLIRPYGKASLCLVEFEREGKSYTFDTVTALQNRYPEKQFAFVCGGDMLTSFDQWYRYEDLMRLLPFIVFEREGTDHREFERRRKQFSAMGMAITVPKTVVPAVSSTAFRAKPEEGGRLLPAEVYAYIKAKGIYQGGTSGQV